MNILYIGHFDNTGYGQAAQGYVNALLSNKYNVICRHFPLSGPASNELPDNIKVCLNKSVDKCNIVIQHTLPIYWEYDSNYKNIGLFVYEMDSFIGNGWESRIKMMDSVIVANQNTLYICKKLNKNSYLIPHAFDIDKYFRKYKSNLKLPNSFKFYTIGEFTIRKNLEDTIKAFHSSFNKTDNVDLIIKTNKSGISPEVLNEQIRSFCHDIKRRMKLYGDNLSYYKDEIIITDRLSENDLYFLHQNSQAFITTSFGEGFLIPAFDAFGFRKPIVYVGDSYDYLGNSSIPFIKDFAYNQIDNLSDLYTGNHLCNHSSIKNISEEMKRIYLNYNDEVKKAADKISNIENFSYEKIGNMFGVVFNRGKNE